MARTPLVRSEPAEAHLDRRIEAVERRTEKVNQVRRPSPAPAATGGSGPYAATRFVASTYATDEEKEGADFVCDGTADQDVINAALNEVYGGPWGSGTVQLSAHPFYVTDEIDIPQHDVSLVGTVGSMHHTQIYALSGFAGAYVINGNNRTHVRIQYLTFQIEDAAVKIARIGAESQFVDNFAESGDSDGILISGYGLTVARNILNVRSAAIGIDGPVLANSRIMDNLIFGFGSPGGVAGVGIRLVRPSSRSGSVIVARNKIASFGGHGIHVALAGDFQILDNHVVECGRVAANTYDGIYLEDDVVESILRGNIVRGDSVAAGTILHRYGINNAAATNERNLISGNHLYRSALTASFNDAGTNTNLVDAAGNFI